ncbi:hypothetical protein AMELA_G00062090 [Ameiurus melas]|uniref:Uncharacterized protein n=1 Tax=Ameiurus melas TaxID=219545 RepID=A0A7J6B257_AMEME|nr:hypothetical protein AMELA_G00062090 [Ameiurus melas]
MPRVDSQPPQHHLYTPHTASGRAPPKEPVQRCTRCVSEKARARSARDVALRGARSAPASVSGPGVRCVRGRECVFQRPAATCEGIREWTAEAES